ncbi:hypothetical protein ZIOFF_061127 [Zingiber officinale]|uniref:Uncharacterized protein n=1 Tax=Zingiber officinale TaxID=94328 RepID=A0A8J5KLK0_ZINOF|nr:hypothetical protein ZIOFF_061127 [Zingiber officinale]
MPGAAAITQGLLRNSVRKRRGRRSVPAHGDQHPSCPATADFYPLFGRLCPRAHGANFRARHLPTDEAWRSRGDDAMTPKQACPRPQGLGHNLRSKTQWFTRFCNSHQVSHFTTFFIDARAEISIAESRLID